MAGKFNNRKVFYDGHKFDSMKERDVYIRLKNDPMVKDIVLQPPFILLDAFEKDGQKYRPIKYIADFDVTYIDGRREIIDAKGFITPEFKLKAKLFDSRYRDLTLVIE